jgi:hypothetical protein
MPVKSRLVLYAHRCARPSANLQIFSAEVSILRTRASAEFQSVPRARREGRAGSGQMANCRPISTTMSLGRRK